MKQVFLIGHLDLRIFLKDKTGYFWLFIVPVLFTFFFSFMNKPPGDPSNPRPGVLIENLDEGALGALLVSALGEQGLEIIQPAERDQAKRGIRIPADFTANVQGKERVDVEYFKLEESQEAAEFMVELRLIRALMSINTNLFRFALDGGNLDAVDPVDLAEQFAQEERVSLQVEWGTRKPLPYGYNQTLPGTMITFLMMNLAIFGASSFSQARLTGVIKRLAIYPVTRWQVVSGKIYGLFLLAVVQIAVFLSLGEFVFKVPISHNPVGIACVLFLFSWIAASFGVLIGAFVTSPEKTYGICIAGSMIMSAFGGCWWPMEVVSDGLRRFGHLFPTAWAMDALHQLISFGGNFGNILPEVAVLLMFAIAGHVIANLSLRYR